MSHLYFTQPSPIISFAPAPLDQLDIPYDDYYSASKTFNPVFTDMRPRHFTTLPVHYSYVDSDSDNGSEQYYEPASVEMYGPLYTQNVFDGVDFPLMQTDESQYSTISSVPHSQSQSRESSIDAISTFSLSDSYGSPSSDFSLSSFSSDDDDEYIPSARSTKSRRPRRAGKRAKKNVLGRKKSNQSRNCQVDFPDSSSSSNSESPAPASPTLSSFKCPFCDWVQRNKRQPDFNRHILTHKRNKDQRSGWWCKGYLLDSSDGQRILSEGSFKPYTFAGQQRIGGCCRDFSRRDALKRHLDNFNLSCFGHAIPAGEERKSY